MTSLALRQVAVCFSAILGSSSLVAQTSGYHMRLEARPAGHPHVVLVNDSEKAIEAFASSQQCKTGGFSAISDVLHSSRNPVGMEGGTEGKLHRTSVLQPGGRWLTDTEIIQDSGALCEAARIDAVLFTDGSLEGKQTAARALKARRDGISAAVKFWVSRIGAENPDGSSLSALIQDATRRVAEDRKKELLYPLLNFHDDPWGTPLYHYWVGRNQVDERVRQRLSQRINREQARAQLRVVSIDVNDWEKKIDNNIALRVLNSIFPTISAP